MFWRPWRQTAFALLPLLILSSSSGSQDADCDLYAVSRRLCAGDPPCALRMHLHDGDSNAFEYLLQTRLLDAPQSEVPYALSSLLRRGLCAENRSELRTLWIMVMRQAHVCRDSEMFDSKSGDCVCLDGRHCQQEDSGSPPFEALTANLLLLALLGILLYVSVSTVTQIRGLQRNLDEAQAKLQKIRTFRGHEEQHRRQTQCDPDHLRFQ